MKNIEFSYSRESLETAIGDATAYSGLKKEDDDNGATFRRVATVAEDGRLLGGFLSQACGTAADRLRGFVGDTSYDGRELRVSLEVSGSFRDEMKGRVESGFRDFVVAYATARWMRLAWSEKAPEWEREAERHLLEVERALCHRPAPKRPFRPTPV